MILSQFDDIEKKVEFLIELCASLKDENSKLKNKIDELDETIQDHSDLEKLNDEEREIVKERVDSLLVKLKDFTEITS